MKSGREQEHLAELSQVLDDGSAGASNDGDNHREPQLEPKHKIFLSHSGVQKNFTEQLCKDLERCHYYPFFDKRPDCLPKGKKFPELIFRAAQQCQVAVLILSEEFFTHTKWPMLELQGFVQSQIENPRKVFFLPVYLGLSRTDCTKNERRRNRWLSVWQKWAEEDKDDKSIDVAEWKNALKVVCRSHGIEYVQAFGEVALRKKIVSAIRHLVPPEKQWSDADVRGRLRIRKAFIKKLMTTKPSPLYGVHVVGVHGMGGIGKTTFCKVLCDELNEMFEGKVFPAELGSKSKIELQKEALRELTDANHDILTCATIETTTNLFRQRIRQQRVFLALDNVWQESIEEARIYLRAGFHQGSIVMVTARSIDILGRMNINESDCMEMPELEEEDAKSLFLHHVGFGHQLWTKNDEQKIEYCIRQCEFRKGENMGKHFHPLALKVLGSQLGSLGRDPSVWVESLSIGGKFNQFREKEHPVFSILRRGFDGICAEDQLLFMDCVLFKPSPMFFRDGEVAIREDVYEWLCIVHQAAAGVIMDRLKGLKAKALIEGIGIGDDNDGVIVHDLHREFAKLEAKHGALDARRWVRYHREAGYPSDLAKTPSGNCWPNVERISVAYSDDFDYDYDDYDSDSDDCVRWRGTIEGVRWQHFSNVVVLQLVIGKDYVLGLQGLHCLRSLMVKWGYCDGGVGKLLGLGELRNLGWLQLRNIHYAPCFEEIDQLTRLEVLRLNTSCRLERLNLDKCIQLRDLVLKCTCLEELPDLSNLTSLRRVVFSSDRAREVELVVEGVKKLVDVHLLRHLQDLQIWNFTIQDMMLWVGTLLTLENLTLKNVPRGVEDLPGIDKLTRLQRLEVDGAPYLLQLPRVSDLVALQILVLIKCCTEVGEAELPDLHNLTNLWGLILSGTPIRSLPGLEHLTQLCHLQCNNTLLAALPDLNSCKYLDNLDLSECRDLTSLGSVAPMTALRFLNVSKCYCLETLPNLRGCKSLQVLDLRHTRVRLLPDNITSLAALPESCELKIWDQEHMNISKLLRDNLAEVVTQFEAKQSQYLATLETSGSY